MKEIIDKISSYNFFNYLLPGILFVIFSKEITKYSFIQSDLVIGVFLYYFIGLIISRFGSLVIEPILKWIHFLEFADYKQFVSASKKNPKIEVLSETNNMYRTIASMLILLLLLKIYELVTTKIQWLSIWTPYILIVLLLIMFLCSHKKQTQYITKRVKDNK